MTVKRIVADLGVPEVAPVLAFYRDLFDLDVVMEMEWVATLASDRTAPIQLSIASDGGSGAEVPNLSIEVDDVDALYERAKERADPIAYELTDEPWGVRRFFVKDPAGTVVNVLSHL